MEWQPIETAPAESVLLLGWWADFLGSKSWECDVEFYEGSGEPHHATHWMPLPNPPKDAG